jgi:hypothetical protein
LAENHQVVPLESKVIKSVSLHQKLSLLLSLLLLLLLSLLLLLLSMLLFSLLLFSLLLLQV